MHGHAMRSRQAGFFLCFLGGLLFVFWTGAIAAMERRKEQEEAEGTEKGKGCGALLDAARPFSRPGQARGGKPEETGDITDIDG